MNPTWPWYMIFIWSWLRFVTFLKCFYISIFIRKRQLILFVLSCFPSLKDNSSALIAVQCLKSYSIYLYSFLVIYGFPPWGSSKESICNSGDRGDAGVIPGQGRSWRRKCIPLQYSRPGKFSSRIDKPSELQFVGSQKVGHDWSVHTRTHTS